MILGYLDCRVKQLICLKHKGEFMNNNAIDLHL